MLQFNSHQAENGQHYIAVFVPGKGIVSADDNHPSFKAIVTACQASLTDATISADDVAGLFDVAATVTQKFQRLSDRISVRNGEILLDGDQVHGTLQDQILSVLEAGEDFAPLVNFYEKMLTNPLGDVREGLYSWIQGQTEDGTLTISTDGDLLGYKSVQAMVPEWRTDSTVVYAPSRRGEGIVNGVEVAPSAYIEQVIGDVVEMPRSKVLNAPSVACGDGLHIGTFAYANQFSGDTIMLVKFSPRDIVSLPDTNSTWKLRVCRYTVVDIVVKSLDVPVYETAYDDHPEIDNDDDELDLEFAEGDRVEDFNGDLGTIVQGDTGVLEVEYDNVGDNFLVGEYEPGELRRVHGTGGPTSYAAKGRGRNPAQDEKGKFSAGRPGSGRDGKTGRFV
jgi:hypothetical protein